jgi:hypothetical protein
LRGPSRIQQFQIIFIKASVKSEIEKSLATVVVSILIRKKKSGRLRNHARHGRHDHLADLGLGDFEPFYGY